MDLSKLFSHSISIDKYFTFVIFKGNCVFGFRTDIWENDIELPAAFPGGSDHCRPKGKKEKTFGERRLSHIWSARQCYAYLIKRSFLQLKATNVWLLQTCSLKCFCGLKREESWGQLLEYILSLNLSSFQSTLSSEKLPHANPKSIFPGQSGPNGFCGCPCTQRVALFLSVGKPQEASGSEEMVCPRAVSLSPGS